MTTAIYESLIENYYDEENDKNNKNWYEKYLFKACIRFALSLDDEIIKEIVEEHHEEAKLHEIPKCELDPVDLYISMLCKWTLENYEEDLQNYKV